MLDKQRPLPKESKPSASSSPKVDRVAWLMGLHTLWLWRKEQRQRG